MTLKVGYFHCLQINQKNQNNRINHGHQEFMKNNKKRHSAEILSEGLLFRPRRSTQGTGIKTTAAEVALYYWRKYMLVTHLKVY